MAVEIWAGLVIAVAIVAAPLLPRTHTPRGRRFRLLGWVLLPLTALLWVGFFAMDPSGVAWLYYPTFVLVIGFTGALLFAGYVCSVERKAYRNGGGA